MNKCHNVSAFSTSAFWNGDGRRLGGGVLRFDQIYVKGPGPEKGLEPLH